MKSNLVKFRDRVFKSLALTFSLSVFLVGCGGQDPVDPNTGDNKGPDITLNFKPDHQPVAVIETQSGLQYIPTSNISYQDSESIIHNFGSYSLKYVKGAGESWAGVWLELNTTIDPANGHILTANIHSTKPREITLKLDQANIERKVSHAGSGHEILEFDFSDNMPAGQFKIAFFSDLNTQGNGTADWTVYIDDLTQISTENKTSTLLVDFDDPSINHITGEFGGGLASVEASPDSSTDIRVMGQIIGYHETHNLGEEYIATHLEASANDTYSGKSSFDSIEVLGSVDVDNPEPQVITYIATDASNNKTELKRFITLVDVESPDIVFSGDRDLIIDLGSTFQDPGATGVDKVPNNINPLKTKTVITQVEVDETGEGYTNKEVEEITTDAVAHFKIAYSFTDNSGNENTSTRNVFVREPFIASQPVLINGEPDSIWSNGIMAYDQGIQYNACTDGDGCPNIKWGKVTDTEKGKVLQINHLDNDFDTGLFISSPSGIDLRGSEKNGLLQMDIKRQSGSDPYIDVWADCGYPCAGGPSRQGPFVTGEWTRIYIPINDILEGPTSRLDLQIVKAGLLFRAASAKDASYRIDNIVWKCQSTCAGDTTPHTPLDWSATHEDPDEGYQAPLAYDGYTLVWSDEFNGNIVNPANWKFDLGNGVDGWGNGELQHYRAENATVDNGLLAIEAQKHQPKLPGDIGYTSAKLITEDLFEFKYGRVDARAVAAKGQGLWSAIWMLGANHSVVGWPRSGEIDILDTIAGNRDGLPQEAMLVNNMYWNAEGSSPDAPYSLGSINQNGSAEYWLNEPTDEDYERPLEWDLDNLPDWMAGPKLDNPATTEIEEIRPLLLTGCEGDSCLDTDVSPTEHKTPVDVDNLPTWITEDPAWMNWENAGGSTETFSNKFHVFSLIWTEDKITFEVDGVETNSIDIKNALTEHYRQTFYLILNVAVGGNWPKAPSATTAFSDGMLVDYVRVYQADSDCDGIADHDWDGDTDLDLSDDDLCD
jgi:beta-glucanase (GH16 family)